MVQTAAKEYRHRDTLTVDALLAEVAIDLNFREQLAYMRERSHQTSAAPSSLPNRQFQRMCSWPSQYTLRWNRFREELVAIGDTEELSARTWSLPEKLGPVAADSTIRWLYERCDPYASESMSLRQTFGLRPVSLDMTVGCHVVAVGLHTMMERYAVSLRSGPAVFAYDDVIWNGRTEVGARPAPPSLAERLVQLEILGYFAYVLIHLARGKQLDDLNRIPLLAFCPTWHRERIGVDHFVRLRGRINESRVLRLLERYRYSRIGEAPDAAPPDFGNGALSRHVRLNVPAQGADGFEQCREGFR